MASGCSVTDWITVNILLGAGDCGGSHLATISALRVGSSPVELGDAINE
jgi:hypothetical protein